MNIMSLCNLDERAHASPAAAASTASLVVWLCHPRVARPIREQGPRGGRYGVLGTAGSPALRVHWLTRCWLRRAGVPGIFSAAAELARSGNSGLPASFLSRVDGFLLVGLSSAGSRGLSGRGLFWSWG